MSSEDKLLIKFRDNPKDQITFQNLEESYFLEKKWAELAEIYQIRAQSLETENRGDASKLLFKLGEIYEKRLNLPEQAVPYYEKALKLNPYSRNVHALIGLYKSTQQWNSAVTLLQNELKLEKDESRQIQLHLELGEIYKTHLRKLSLAIDHYKAILKAEQYHRESILSLQEIYQAQENWKLLQEMLLLQLSVEKDKTSQIELYQHLALLAQERFQDVPQAISYYQKIIELHPAHLKALHQLEGLYLSQNDYLNQVEMMNLRAKQTPEAELRTQLYLTISRIWEEALQNFPNSARALRKILVYDKNNLFVLNQLERLYRTMEDWGNVTEMLERKLSLTHLPEERKSFSLELADLWANKLQNEDNAIHYYRSIIELEPNHFDVLHLLQSLYHKRGYLAELLQTLQIEIEQTPSVADKIELYYQVGELAYQKLGQKETAVQAYLAILDLVPNDQQSLEALKNVYLETEDWEALLTAYHRELKLCESPTDKIDTFLKIGKLLTDKLTRHEEASEYYKQILILNPKHLKAVQELKELYRYLEDPANLLRMLQQELELVSAPEQKVPLFMEMGQIQWTRFEQARLAIATFRQVLEQDPFFLAALQALKSIFYQEGQWEDFVAMAKQEAELQKDHPTKIKVILSIAKVLQEKLSQPEKSIVYYEKVEELDPGNEQAREQLKSLYRQTSRWETLIRFLLKETQYLSLPQQLYGQYQEVALLYTNALKQPQNSIVYWEKNYSLIPSKDPLEALIPLYESSEQWELLVSTYRRKLDLTPIPGEKIPLLLALGDILRLRLDKLEEALKVYQMVIDIDPAHLTTLNLLETLLTQQSHWELLVSIHQKQIYALTDVALKIEYHQKLSRLYETHLNKPKAAVKEFLSILELTPDSSSTIEELLRLYRDLNFWHELVGILERKMRLVSEVSKKVQLLFEMGHLLQEKLRHYKRAIEKYEEILLLEQEDPKAEAVQKANTHLIELHQILKEWRPLLKNYHLWLTYTELPAEKIQICHKIANVNRIELLDLNAAEKILNEALLQNEFDLPTIQELEMIAREKGEYEKQIDYLESQINLAETDEERKALLFRVTEVYQLHLGDFPQAIFTLNRVLEINEKDLQTRQKLVQLYLLTARYSEAIQILQGQLSLLEKVDQQKNHAQIAWIFEHYLKQEGEAIAALESAILDEEATPYYLLESLIHLYRKQQRYEDVLRILNRYLHLPNLAQETRLSLLLEAGYLLDAFLNKPDYAESFYLKALEIDPGKLRALKALEKIYHGRKAYAELADTYEKELKVIEEPSRSIFLKNQLGELYEKHLKQREKAINCYHSVFSFDPKNLQAIRSLGKIYQENHHYEKLCSLYEKEISITRDPLRKLDLYEQLGDLYENQLSQRKRAIIAYLQAHEHHPKNLSYLKKLAELYQKESDWTKLLEILEASVQLAEEPEEQVAFLLRKGSLQFQELQNELLAEQTFLQLLEIEPKHTETIAFLKRIYEKKYPLKWVRIVEKEIEGKPEESELIDSLLQIGKIYEAHQKNEEAISYFCRVNQIEPGHKVALNELLKLYQKEEKWLQLIAIFELAAKLTKNAEEEMKLHFKTGEIYANRLLDSSKAILCFQKVLALQSNSISAIQNISQLYRHLENWNKVVEYLLLEIEANPTESESIPALYLDIATLYEQKLGQPANAIEYYLKYLRRHFEIGPPLIAAKKILAQLDRYEEWIELLREEEKNTSDPLQKSLLLYTIGTLYESHLLQVAVAIPFYRKAVEQNPLNQKAWRVLATSYESEFFYLEASLALEKVVAFEEAQHADKEILLPLYLRLANLYRLKLGQFHLATPFYEKVLALQPQDESILHILQDLYRSLGQHKKLIELLLKELQQTTHFPRKVELFEETGTVWEFRLFVEDSAIVTYEKLLEIDTENTKAIQALRRLYQNGEHFSKLILLHQKEIRLAQNAEDLKTVIKLYHRIATIYARDLQDPQSAIQTLNLLLEQEPHNQSALQFLQQLHQEGKDYESLVTAYKKELEITTSETRQLFCFFEIARLSEEKRNRPAEAILYYRRVLQLDSAHLISIRALRRLYREQQAWDRLIEMTEQEANLLEDLLLKADLHFSLGELWSEKFQNSEKAIFHFQKALEYNTGYLKAMQCLKQIYLAQEAWQKAIETLEMEIKYSPEKQTKVELWTQMGLLYENSLHQVDAALERYEKALDLNPSHLPAIIPLAHIQYQLKNWEQSVALFTKYLQTELAPEKRAPLAYQLADSYQQLQKMDLALFHYQESFHLFPDYLPNLKALGAVYVRLEQWPQALEVFLRLCPQVTQESEYPTYLFQLAQIYEKLQQFSEAIETYKKALLLKPHSIPEIFRLVALYEKQKTYADLVPLLQNSLQKMDPTEQDLAYLSLGKAQFYLRQPKEAIHSLRQCSRATQKESLQWIAKTYLQEEQYAEAIETLKNILPQISSENPIKEKVEKSECWFQIGKIYEEQLQLFADASLAYREAQKWEPQSLYLIEALGKTLEKQENWDTLIQEFELFIRKLPPNEKQKSLSLHLKLGQVYFEQLQNAPSAIQHYKEALKIEPNHYTAHLALAKIQSGDQNSFHEAYQEHLYLLQKDPCLLDSYHTLGKICRHQGKWDAYFSICLILAFFKDLQKEELQFYNTQHSQIHLQPQYPLSIEAIETLLLGDIKNHLLRKIIQLTHESIEKAYPPAFEALQLRKKDRLNLEESALLNKIIGELKAIFHLPEVHVYLTEVSLNQPLLESTLPPSLILSRQMINEFSLEELLFAIGRQFFFMADSQNIVSKLSEEEFDAYFLHLGGGADATEEPKRETQKRVRGSIARKVKKDLEELLQQYHLQQKNISTKEYRRKMFQAANACGFLLSNSLLHSARCLAKFERRPSLSNLTTIQMIEQTRQWPEMLHLLRFGLSPEFYKLRQNLNLLASASS